MPKVSVIIPVYNAENYLKECLESVINQTLKDIEVICVDDGSTDNSYKILQEYEQKDKRIIVLKQKNKGAGAARNLGIELAQGEFIAFMDADDKYPNCKILKILYNITNSNNMQICGGEFSEFTNNCDTPNQNKTIWKEKECSLDGYLFPETKIIKYKDYQFDYGYHRFLYNRNFLITNKIYFPNYKRFQDPPFFVQAMIKAEKFYAVNKISYAYRTGHNIIRWDSKKTNDMLKGILDNMQYAYYHKLQKLNEYSLVRLKQHYPLIENFINLKSIYLIRQMKKYNTNINNFIKEKKLEFYKYLCKSILQFFFSIRNSKHKSHKIITFLGLKISFRRSNVI